MFFLHGSNNSADIIRMATAYEFDQLAEQHGYIMVYPQGYKKHWNDCRGSASYAANTDNIDDIAFFKAMINYFVDKASIDREQVFVAGISNGGQLAYKLAFESPESVTAIATFAANLPEQSNLDCSQSGQPISVAIFNGTEDAINPYNGGLVDLFGDTSRGVVLSTRETVDYWLRLAGITSAAQEKTLPERDGLAHTSVIEQRWQNNEGIQVRFYSLQGSGHVMPSTITRAPRILGEKSGDISGAEEIIDFFLNQSE
ncbi:hypothetical protein BST96_14615 [Oceanicoccus sagamiensis]|uniref:Phospholipase/carboxylesterase/thioesterase domain-containing protein n=1 Tax=Oceanicoccus sagamiensis TaxID=716816 RepID=A0A1X9NNV8_9GAMM|nr:hypothetical protein BST96_14615 [Oceanicoccus sagamiensis]